MLITIEHIIAFVVAVLVLITVHELGHFWVAKCFKVKVLRFSIGFGKPIWRRMGKDGTEYVIGFLPLGGYIKMLDEAEGHVPEEEKHLAFNHKPVLQRFLIVLAGPLTNFLFGIIAFWLMFSIGITQIKPVIGTITPNSIAAEAGMQSNQQFVSIDGDHTKSWQNVLMAVARKLGESGIMHVQTKPLDSDHVNTYELNITNWKVSGLTPQPLQSLGISPYHPPVSPVIVVVKPDSPAAKAGLKAGDKIVEINDKPIKDWYTFVKYIQKHPNQLVRLQILRDNKPMTITPNVGRKLSGLRWIGFLGVESKIGKWPEDMILPLNYNILTAWWPATQEVYELTTFNFVMLGKMLIGRISLQSIGGPITIFRIADKAFKQGLVIYIGFLALVSVMLGFVNLLPIPGLDGGHLFYYLIEIVRRKPLSVAVQALTIRLGIIFLIILIVQATINDVMRLV